MVAPVNFEVLPAGTTVEHLPFTAEDGALSVGFLYSKGGERGVICMTHPRGGLERHYMIPTMIEAGFAVFSFNHRMRTDDFDLVHEMLLLDIAGALTTMKTDAGMTRSSCLATAGAAAPWATINGRRKLLHPTGSPIPPLGTGLTSTRSICPGPRDSSCWPPDSVKACMSAGGSTHRSSMKQIPCLVIPISTCTAAETATGSRRPRAPTARNSGSATAPPKRHGWLASTHMPSR